MAVRNEVIPALARALGRDPVPLLNRHAELASQALEVIVPIWRPDSTPPTNGPADLAAAPRAVAAEALRNVDLRGPPALPPSAGSIDRVFDVAAGRSIATEITGGHRVARTAGRLRIERHQTDR